MEIYKIIEDYPKYRVSNYGNIQSSWIKNEWRTLKTGTDAKGYLQVGLCDGIHKVKTFRIHRLVATYFVEKPDEEGLIVRHLDSNPENNHFLNLKWGTYKENEEDKKLNGTWYTGRLKSSKLSFEMATEIRTKYQSGQSQISLAEEYGVTRPTITRVINKKIWKEYVDYSGMRGESNDNQSI